MNELAFSKKFEIIFKALKIRNHCIDKGVKFETKVDFKTEIFAGRSKEVLGCISVCKRLDW